jgi:hypothetical protein
MESDNLSALENDLRAYVRESEDRGHRLWSGLANVRWCPPEVSGKRGKREKPGEMSMSMRSAGGWVADLRDDGSEYVQWYMDGCWRGSYPFVCADVAEVFARHGLRPVGWDGEELPLRSDEEWSALLARKAAPDDPR